MGFINDDFLLKGDTAKQLYNDYAKDLPIIDYHCHISPQEIWEDRRFETITQVWLGGDHYKWRLLRSNGIDEDEITGSADDKVKFLHFAELLPKSIGNPMYHWAHLELKKYFGYDGILNRHTAEEVWSLCNDKLQNGGLTVREFIRTSNVAVIATTDDPVDDLHFHELIAGDSGFETKVVPSFRPDKAINIEKAGFADYIQTLSHVCGFEIATVVDVKRALTDRLAYFADHGCKASDHGLDRAVYSLLPEADLNDILSRVLRGETITQDEADAYKTHILLHLGREYAKRNIAMQIHYGALRNPNTRMFQRLGPDTGFDCISTESCSDALAKFMDALDAEHCLPKTILYSLNPQDNGMLDALIGSFQGTETAGKIQHGAAWWFNDTKRGMEEQLRSLADVSLLGNFLGMLTDSRSFLSYVRHDYFRRILCSLIGGWVDDGQYPNDQAALQEIIEGICYKNAERYFHF